MGDNDKLSIPTTRRADSHKVPGAAPCGRTNGPICSLSDRLRIKEVNKFEFFFASLVYFSLISDNQHPVFASANQHTCGELSVLNGLLKEHLRIDAADGMESHPVDGCG